MECGGCESAVGWGIETLVFDGGSRGGVGYLDAMLLCGVCGDLGNRARMVGRGKGYGWVCVELGFIFLEFFFFWLGVVGGDWVFGGGEKDRYVMDIGVANGLKLRSHCFALFFLNLIFLVTADMGFLFSSRIFELFDCRCLKIQYCMYLPCSSPNLCMHNDLAELKRRLPSTSDFPKIDAKAF